MPSCLLFLLCYNYSMRYLAVLALFFAPTGFFALAEAQEICTEEYNPVCAELQVQCIKAPCEPVFETFANDCKAKNRGAKILYKGECKKDYTAENPEQNPNCQSWFDGCNSCARRSPGAPALCTKRYCPQDLIAPAVCKTYFNEKGDEEKNLNDPSAALPPREFDFPPVPMDEPGEIEPTFSLPKDAEIISDDLSSYATDALEEKEKINLSGEIFTAYDDGSIFLNISHGDTFDKSLQIVGFIDSKKGRFGPFEGQAGSVSLLDLHGKNLTTRIIKLKPNWQEEALQGKKLWFDLDFDLRKYKSGNYFLLFKNENPSGLKQNDAEFKISIKIKHKEKELSPKEKLLQKYPDYKFVADNKQSNSFVLEKERKLKLLWIFPVKMKETIFVDKDTLLLKDKKTPWWSWLAF